MLCSPPATVSGRTEIRHVEADLQGNSGVPPPSHPCPDTQRQLNSSVFTTPFPVKRSSPICVSLRNIIFLGFDRYINRPLCIYSSTSYLFSLIVMFLRFTHVDASNWISRPLFPPACLVQCMASLPLRDVVSTPLCVIIFEVRTFGLCVPVPAQARVL